MKKSILIPIASVAVTALILFGASNLLSGMAIENGRKEHISMMQTLLPGSENFTVEPYAGEDENIVSVHKAENGFVIETKLQKDIEKARA